MTSTTGARITNDFSPELGDVILQEVSGHRYVPLRRTGGAITSSEGYGGHPAQVRPKQRSLTIWAGRAPFKFTVPLYLYNGGESIEPLAVKLEQMATGETQKTEPPEIELLKASGRHLRLPPTPSNRWWIEDLNWKEQQAREKDWSVTRAEVDVVLLEVSNDPGLTPKQGYKTYLVKKGDTLHSIASRQLHDAERWKEISQLNNIRDSVQLRKHIGKKIKLP